ncbi:DNA (cytosine-5)-methyltransferase 1 [Nonomuraea muscovyensis]|uniref:DNA (cytosine-5-)-methyltransferase n=1 Tax=Nonomuraea muscovyensis TaxID=1124761 RepID=A0A7X0C221_9ACTN|nr:DNA cytosine methyltransferase [Nonomuraea muscovyensis]MBB6345254.1 DNA (cytosine-5)-methyltransferase 1 [Nonomuraea muscovyensis]
MNSRFTSLEVCAGVGGQALGLERAGFDPVMLVDDDPQTCATLRANRPDWRVLQADLNDFVGTEHGGVADVDLLSAGVPSAPFATAGRQHGISDRRDLLRTVIFLVMDVRPRVVMLESTPNLLTNSKFEAVRRFVSNELEHMGYCWTSSVLDAQHFGVPQTRRSGIIIAMRPDDFERFSWPVGNRHAPTLGEALRESMASRGWSGADEWARIANQVAPTIVGGSKKHGGADLGPTRSKRSWQALGVDGGSLGDQVPGPEFVLAPEAGRSGLPKLTIAQVQLLQNLPTDWEVTGRKTAAYRQVAQAMPPAVSTAVGRHIAQALAR